MARPFKSGVDYWPFDCDFFNDRKLKLIKAEFGIKGAYIALYILNSVYKENGYYKRWDDDDCFLTSEGVGGDCTPELVEEVKLGCLRRGLFDARTFDVFGVLTSPGIQRRYLRIVSNNRQDIRIIEEYWLLDNKDTNDVPDGILDKVTFKKVSLKENAVIRKENPVKLKDNTQIKENKIKENEIKDICVSVIAHLNEKAGTHYRTSDVAVKHIRARLREGYKQEDFFTVIDKKCKEWINTDMARYLRPETLFGTKFESYLNAPAATGKRKYDQVASSLDGAAFAKKCENYIPTLPKRGDTCD